MVWANGPKIGLTCKRCREKGRERRRGGMG